MEGVQKNKISCLELLRWGVEKSPEKGQRTSRWKEHDGKALRMTTAMLGK
jgi:hypothetical protein